MESIPNPETNKEKEADRQVHIESVSLASTKHLTRNEDAALGDLNRLQAEAARLVAESDTDRSKMNDITAERMVAESNTDRSKMDDITAERIDIGGERPKA